jgi:hypothetical protein
MGKATKLLMVTVLFVLALPAYGFDFGGLVKDIAKNSTEALRKAEQQLRENQNQDRHSPKPQQPAVDSDTLLLHYQKSTSELVAAQVHFLRAFDMKQDAAELEAESIALSNESISTKELGKITRRSIRANNVIQEKIGEEKRLSKEARKYYMQGMVPYLNGCRELTIVNKKVHYLEEGVHSKDIHTQIRAAEVGLFLLENLTPYMVSLRKTSSSVLGYAKSNKVKVPSDATVVFSDL